MLVRAKKAHARTPKQTSHSLADHVWDYHQDDEGGDYEQPIFRFRRSQEWLTVRDLIGLQKDAEKQNRDGHEDHTDK